MIIRQSLIPHVKNYTPNHLLTCAWFTLLWILCPILASLGMAKDSPSTDWPMWRYDAHRSAAAPASLAETLHLQWTRDLPQPTPAWHQEQPKLQFDRSYEPVVMGKQLFLPSMVSDSLSAYDTDQGRLNWTFYCDGPIRFAPVAWKDKVYCISDDGHLYSLHANTGDLAWQVRLAPSSRKVLGNGRLISAWPARGGPVLRDSVLYCSAGIWPFMGVFIHAIDAQTGRVLWVNSGSGSAYIKQPHNSDAFGGVAPQGYLTATRDKLLVTSRTLPACFDRQTGNPLYYHLSNRDQGKYAGGYQASVWRDWIINNNVTCRTSDGTVLAPSTVHCQGPDALYSVDPNGDLKAHTLKEVNANDAKKKERMTLAEETLWTVKLTTPLDRIHIRAGDRLYGSNQQGVVAAIDIPKDQASARLSWQTQIDGTVWSILAADNKLMVVTEQGRLYCFGPDRRDAKRHGLHRPPMPKTSKIARQQAAEILQQPRTNQGYCLWLGVKDPHLLWEVIRQSDYRIVVLEPDSDRVDRLRRGLDRVGLYGTRVAVHTGDITSFAMPPYLAGLIVADEAQSLHDSGKIEAVFNSLRPYDGLAWLGAEKPGQLILAGDIDRAHLVGSTSEGLEQALLLRRSGPLPGSSQWTHQHGNIANTGCSQDQIKLPLGVLWFGEDSRFTDVLPRHAHGPPEQVAGGRLFIQGVNSITARDVYTGRTLWKKVIETLDTAGVYYDDSYVPDFRDRTYNQQHIPGASARGTNFVVTPEYVYVAAKAQCLVLDATTGDTVSRFSLPTIDGQSPSDWGYIGVYEHLLIAGCDFVAYSNLPPTPKKKGNKKPPAWTQWPSFINKSASQRLVIMNRYTGQVLWTRKSQYGFLHNAIAAGDDRLYCIDSEVPSVVKLLKRSEAESNQAKRLLALEIHTGQVVWENTDHCFGTWLSYSQDDQVLVQAYRSSRDMLWEPNDRMATHHTVTGELIWDKKIRYSGPIILHRDHIITQDKAFMLKTGEPLMRSHPLTGEPIPWQYSRNYGCGTATASEHLLMFRSAAAGYFDLDSDGGTGNLGGFRSGCTANLVAADGVLSAPDYTRTCTCSYQNQTSLALVPMPEGETWTFNSFKLSKVPITRLGINFGAPGDRRADNGTLWLDYPSTGGSSPDPTISVEPKTVQYFREHSSRLRSGARPWVEASGLKGARTIDITLDPQANPSQRLFTVTLHFAEFDHSQPGQRRFTVSLQDKPVLVDFDILTETTHSHIGLVRQFKHIAVTDRLTIDLTPAQTQHETLISGIEITAETTNHLAQPMD